MAGEKDAKDLEVGHDNKGYMKDIVYNENKKPAPATSEKEDEVKDTEAEDKVDLSCGIWKLRTNLFGTWFANLYVFSIFVGLSSFFTIMVQSVLHIQLTSIERQFNIDNAKAGLFDTASRIGSLSTILFAGHFAKKVHIPMVVGLAGIIQGFVLMVPGFIQFADPYTLQVIEQASPYSNLTNHTNYGDNGRYLCNANLTLHNNHSTAKEDQSNNGAFITIAIVQAIKGVTDSFHAGFLPSLYTDDNMLDKTRMGIYFGINSVITELASPIGKQINGFLSTVPVDLKKTEMDPKDSRFVAAWWLAFLVFGIGTVVFSFPIMLFPKKLVSKRQQEAALKKAMVTFTAGNMVDEEAILNEDKTVNIDRKPSIVITGINSSRPTSQYEKKYLSPRLSFQSGTVDALGPISKKRSSLLPPIDGPTERRVSIDGTMVFEQPVKAKVQNDKGESIQGSSNLMDLIKDFPKAFIRLFRRPVFILIILDIIIVSIPMSGIAIFRSTYIKSEYNVAMSEVAMLTGVTQGVGQILGTLVSGWLANKVKTKLGYNYIIVGTYLISICITPLYIVYGCDNQPIYGHEGRFGVPLNTTDTCGCRDTKQLLSCGDDGNNYLSPCYAGCQSVEGKLFTMCGGLSELNITHPVTLTPGLCSTRCHDNFLIYVLLHAVQMLLSSMGTIPRRLLILRMVDPRDRGFATSIFAFSSTLMAIPSPNLFGRIIDNTCLIWDGNYCVLYDRDQIRYLLSGIDVGVNGAIQITMFLIMYIFRKEERDLKRKLQLEQQNKSKDMEMEIKLQ